MTVNFLIKTMTMVVLTAFSIGCATTSSNQSGGDKSTQKIVIALKPDKNPDQMTQERVSLEKYMSEKLARPVEVIIPLSAAVINEGFANGTIDVGYLSATDLINAKNAELLLVGEIGGKTTYKSYWLRAQGKTLRKSRRFARQARCFRKQNQYFRLYHSAVGFAPKNLGIGKSRSRRFFREKATFFTAPVMFRRSKEF
jgi:ABC-type phosphate/phosphonate transport system substrate-binding protein